jgi:hypothetical protein
VVFSCDTKNGANGQTNTFALFNGVTQDTGSTRAFISGAAVQAGIATQTIMTVDGSTAISIQWNTSGNTATSTGHSLTLIRVGS